MRLLAPLLSAGMIPLSLERLGFLHWAPAAVLFVLLAFAVVQLELRKRKAREEFDGQDR